MRYIDKRQLLWWFEGIARNIDKRPHIFTIEMEFGQCRLLAVFCLLIVKLTKGKYVFINLFSNLSDTYSRVQKSIENWSVCSKMTLGEVGVSLPWWCHPLVLLAPGYWRLFLNSVLLFQNWKSKIREVSIYLL